MIYLIHFDRPLHHAQHYIGFCKEGSLADRIKQHTAGRGAKILAALKARNIGWQVVKTFAGDRHEERRMKNCKKSALFCPICQNHSFSPELFDDYYQRPEISNSDLSIYKSVLRGKPYVIPQSAFRLGQAVHECILEPYSFQWETYPDVDRPLVERLAYRFLDNRFCQSLLKGALLEQPHFKLDEETGIRTRCKADILRAGLLVDIKTTRVSSEAAFKRACSQYEYDRQMAFYANAFGCDQVLIVGISKTANKLFFQEYATGASFLIRGKKKYRFLLNKLAGNPMGLPYIYAIRAAYAPTKPITHVATEETTTGTPSARLPIVDTAAIEPTSKTIE